ncbi:MAG: hypothetical protein EBZ77_04570 [Chitinophagia bacterium]|nr:hypothetical protein [Chitinophagia bacterium]
MKTVTSYVGAFAIVVAAIIFVSNQFYKAADTIHPTATQVSAPQVPQAAPANDITILKSSALSKGMGLVEVDVRIRNGNEPVSYADFVATFYDEQGNMLGTGIGNTTNLAAGAEKTVVCIASQINQFAKYDVQVNNVMR